MKVAVLIPGHNEEKYLATVLKKVTKQHAGPVVVIDDGSTDKTSKVAKRYTEHVLRHELNLGKGAALLTGCEYAFDHLQADAVIFMDADDQHDPVEIPRFISELKAGSTLVFGVRRESADMPLFRFLGNKLASVMLNILFQKYIPDIPSGYKAIARTAFPKVRWSSTGYAVEAEIAARTARNKLPFSTIDIEAIYHDTDKGMTLAEGLRIAVRLLQWKMEL